MKQKNKVVLDASALLALLHREKGHEKVAAVMERATMNTVNVAEVIGKLARLGMTAEEIEMILAGLDIDTVDFDLSMASVAGNLIVKTQEFGLSLGDRACLALALERKLPVMTSDRIWENLDLGVPIELLR